MTVKRALSGRNFLIYTSLLLGVGCASGPASGDRIQYSYQDNPRQQQIVVNLENISSGAVCLPHSSWPDDKGRVAMHMGVYVEIEGRVFVLQDLGHYDCFDFDSEGLCTHLVSPGEKLTGVLPYKNFDLQEIYWSDTKTLRFQPQYYFDEEECP